MRLVTFEIPAPLEAIRRVGVWDGETTILDVNAAYRRQLDDAGTVRSQALADAVLPADMLQLLEGGGPTLDLIAATHRAAVASRGESSGERPLWWSLDEVRLLSPLPRPCSIRDFLLVEEHVRNAFDRLPAARRPPHTIEAMAETPGYYKSSVETVLGPEDELPWPVYTEELDYELELAVVIGKPGRNVSVATAHEHIAGYTILNDWSARDIQMLEMRVGLGPGLGKDFANSLGPCIQCSADFDPLGARMVARVNGEIWSDGRVDAMLRSFPELVAWTSRAERLNPGDVIGSGTIARGCGLELGRYLWPGAVVELDVEGIGVLRNRVGPRPAAEPEFSW